MPVSESVYRSREKLDKVGCLSNKHSVTVCEDIPIDKSYHYGVFRIVVEYDDMDFNEIASFLINTPETSFCDVELVRYLTKEEFDEYFTHEEFQEFLKKGGNLEYLK
jgi:hypothetical protein